MEKEHEINHEKKGNQKFVQHGPNNNLISNINKIGGKLEKEDTKYWHLGPVALYEELETEML